jgi:CBS domain-containing protein
MSKRVVRGFLRSDGKPDFSTSKFTKPGELEYLSQKPVYSATSRSPIIKGIDLMICRGIRRVPITDSRGGLLGIVTSMDVVNFLGGGNYHNIVKSKHGGRFFSALNEPLESIMTKEVVCAETTESFSDVLVKMIEHGYSAMPIVKKPKTLVGIITEYDVVHYLSGRSSSESVQKYMSRNPVIASPDITINSAAKLMVSNGFRRIPLKREDTMVGIVTATDIVRYIGEGSAFRRIMMDEMDRVMARPVEEIMMTNVVTVDKDLLIGEAAPMIRSSGVGAVLVRDNGELVGILTERDLLMALSAG